MKYLLLSLMLLAGCGVDKETVFVAKGTPGGNGSSCTTYPVEGGANVKCGDSITFIANGSKGDSGASGSDGSSCSVAPEYAELEDEVFTLSNELILIGAKISCTDGTSQVVYNGDKGDAGDDGVSCSALTNEDGNVTLSCPKQEPLVIYNGKDGDSCTTKRQPSKKRTKITCGNTVSYVFDGKKGEPGEPGEPGQPGSSCTVTPTTSGPAGANVTCGGTTVLIANGQAGSSVTVSSATVAQCPTGGVVLTGGITICNGATGSAGTGATVSDLSSNSCTLINGSSPAFYVDDNDLYTPKDGNNCGNKVADLQDGEVIFVAPKLMVVKDADTGKLKLINFN